MSKDAKYLEQNRTEQNRTEQNRTVINCAFLSYPEIGVTYARDRFKTAHGRFFDDEGVLVI